MPIDPNTYVCLDCENRYHHGYCEYIGCTCPCNGRGTRPALALPAAVLAPPAMRKQTLTEKLRRWLSIG